MIRGEEKGVDIQLLATHALERIFSLTRPLLGRVSQSEREQEDGLVNSVLKLRIGL